MVETVKQIQKEINSLYCEMGLISKTEVNKIFAKYYQKNILITKEEVEIILEAFEDLCDVCGLKPEEGELYDKLVDWGDDND